MWAYLTWENQTYIDIELYREIKNKGDEMIYIVLYGWWRRM